ncbi:antibiotic biosynthesis monooxygenase [Ciceribacter sp. RN22]|uniref:antibiotic biosynthesis monooxygenase family protein n=1 Tax=Ciceribacter sp. RN22 TaxID=2954932 RepID=UPI00209329A7|nr:antibiotic biosynthesis monooxygenase family protein [Ciceribacter sp. RN22]MCO6179427.1 antibiotic biosynthesis monooxygenase [Ciceribacter sp. RN22]
MNLPVNFFLHDKSGIMLVNVVHVDEGKQDAALDVLRKTVQYVADTIPGFRWSRLYRSTDGKTVINHALWRNEEDFKSIFSDQEFLDRYNGLKETGTWEFHLYTLSDVFLPAQAEGTETTETAASL